MKIVLDKYGRNAAPDDDACHARFPDGITSHSTKLPKDGNQVAGYRPNPTHEPQDGRRADERSVNQWLMSPYFGDLAEWLCKAGFSYGGRCYALAASSKLRYARFPPYMLPPVHGTQFGRKNWRLRSLPEKSPPIQLSPASGRKGKRERQSSIPAGEGANESLREFHVDDSFGWLP